MIDVHNLAIGNWVYDGECTQFPMYVQTIGEDYVYLDFPQNEGDIWEFTPEELQGIPLTEELLKKIGFKYSKEDSKEDSKEVAVYSLRINLGNMRHIKIIVCPEYGGISLHDVTTNGEFGTKWYHYTIHQKFLHELQNFVFITTKQQLKIDICQELHQQCLKLAEK